MQMKYSLKKVHLEWKLIQQSLFWKLFFYQILISTPSKLCQTPSQTRLKTIPKPIFLAIFSIQFLGSIFCCSLTSVFGLLDFSLVPPLLSSPHRPLHLLHRSCPRNSKVTSALRAGQSQWHQVWLCHLHKK